MLHSKKHLPWQQFCPLQDGISRCRQTSSAVTPPYLHRFSRLSPFAGDHSHHSTFRRKNDVTLRFLPIYELALPRGLVLHFEANEFPSAEKLLAVLSIRNAGRNQETEKNSNSSKHDVPSPSVEWTLRLHPECPLWVDSVEKLDVWRKCNGV